MNKLVSGKYQEHVLYLLFIIFFLEPKHAFLGMFTSFSSILNVNYYTIILQGDLNALKTSFDVDAPFVFVDVDGLGNSGTLIYTSFADYSKALVNVVTKQLPDVVTSA